MTVNPVKKDVTGPASIEFFARVAGKQEKLIAPSPLCRSYYRYPMGRWSWCACYSCITRLDPMFDGPGMIRAFKLRCRARANSRKSGGAAI
jgi:hypothetical protein